MRTGKGKNPDYLKGKPKYGCFGLRSGFSCDFAQGVRESLFFRCRAQWGAATSFWDRDVAEVFLQPEHRHTCRWLAKEFEVSQTVFGLIWTSPEREARLEERAAAPRDSKRAAKAGSRSLRFR